MNKKQQLASNVINENVHENGNILRIKDISKNYVPLLGTKVNKIMQYMRESDPNSEQCQYSPQITKPWHNIYRVVEQIKMKLQGLRIR